MRAVILAGGKGSRLAPYTTILPKPLMPVGEKSILEIVIRQLKHYGFRKITLAIGYQGELIRTLFQDGKSLGVAIEYSEELAPLGTAAPLLLIENLPDTFLVMNGDILTDLDYSAFIEFHKQNKATATIGLCQKKQEVDLGIIEADEEGRVSNYIEKPSMTYEVSMGIYMFEIEVLKYLKKGLRLDMPDLIKLLVRGNHRVLGYRHTGYWHDIGRIEDFNAATELFNRDPSKFLL
ncbi:MAG TPA: sugar phosphate nucleotidyltransferase [bacterium]